MYNHTNKVMQHMQKQQTLQQTTPVAQQGTLGAMPAKEYMAADCCMPMSHHKSLAGLVLQS
jgi:hypothetical protein